MYVDGNAQHKKEVKKIAVMIKTRKNRKMKMKYMIYIIYVYVYKHGTTT